MWGHVKYEIYDFASGNSESKKKKKKGAVAMETEV